MRTIGEWNNPLDEAYEQYGKKLCLCGGKLEIEDLAYPYLHVEIVCQECGVVDEFVEWEPPVDHRYL